MPLHPSTRRPLSGRLRLPLLAVTAAAVLAACGGGDDEHPVLKTNRAPYPLVEATIADFHAAMQRDDVSCRDVVLGSLARIAAYDAEPSTAYPASPALHSVIAVSPTALAQADALDRQFFTSGRMAGPLHCVTVLVKDNYDTYDMKTTAPPRPTPR